MSTTQKSYEVLIQFPGSNPITKSTHDDPDEARTAADKLGQSYPRERISIVTITREVAIHQSPGEWHRDLAVQHAGGMIQFGHGLAKVAENLNEMAAHYGSAVRYDEASVAALVGSEGLSRDPFGRGGR